MSVLATPASPRDTTIADAIPDIFVNRPTAAELLSTHARRVVVLARQGKISTRQVPGGRERYSLRDLIALLAAS